MMGPVQVRNYGCRLNVEWRLRGLRTVILENELLRVGVLADKGTEIFEFLYKPLDVDFLYLAPRGVQNPRHDTPSVAPQNGGFLDAYSGGWQEIFPNGGPACTHNGAEYGQHGEVALAPWSFAVSHDSPDEVSVDFWIEARRTPCLMQKRLTLRRGLPVLFIEERLTNRGAEPVRFMWGHHVAFGAPFLAAGCTIDAPAGRLIVEDDQPGFGPRLYRPGSESKWPGACPPEGAPAGAAVGAAAAGGDRIAADVVPAVDPARGAEEMA
ncbi:MAG TPA: DUF4432 family protein, partial [Limnochordia bacterium]|nr:DUF4432 family protein [Limnochordia bacterium]